MLSNSRCRAFVFLVIPTVMSACTEEGLLADADRHLNGFRCDVVQVITEYADDSDRKSVV